MIGARRGKGRSMPGVVVKTGDMIQITIMPPAVVPMVIPPIPMVGTGVAALVMGMPICVFGDELPPPLRVPLPYIAPPFVTPGMGTLTLILTPANFTAITMVSNKPVLIAGAPFTATFNVTVPAMMPTPAGPVPDPLLVKPGIAQFIPTFMTLTAS